LRAATCLQNQSHDNSDREEDTKDIENINNILTMYVDLDLTKVKYNKLRTYNKMIQVISSVHCY